MFLKKKKKRKDNDQKQLLYNAEVAVKKPETKSPPKIIESKFL